MRGADRVAEHFLWSVDDGVATVTLNRPERKNPLTFESYAELRDTFLDAGCMADVGAIVVTGASGNFCSGGDVHDIIGPLVRMDFAGRLAFTRMTGDLVAAMIECPKVIVAAVDGVCAGAGACVAMASDLRIGTERSRVAFLFARVGLSGCDMGACAMLPRLVGHGRAAELLYTGRDMSGPEALEWGFFNRLVEPGDLLHESRALASRIARGPTAAHALTKDMLKSEWDLGLVEAIRCEAEAQARCMGTRDFQRAYDAFVAKRTPRFEGN